MSKRKTNDQFLKDLVKNSSNPMVGPFIIDAMCKVAHAQLDTDEIWPENSLISQDLWKATAKEILEKTEAHLES